MAKQKTKTSKPAEPTSHLIRYRIYGIVLLFVIAVRVMASLLPSFQVDLTGWRFWSERMVELGPMHFYSPTVFTSNPPGFLYVFWLLGLIKHTFFPSLVYGSIGHDFLLKLPTNIADLIAGYFIYKLVKSKTDEFYGILAFLLYTLNPAIIFNSSVWGQFDGFATAFMIFALYCILQKKWYAWSAVALAIAWAVKPQAIAAFPAFGILYLTQLSTKKVLTTGLFFAIATLAIYWPFFLQNPFYGVYYVNTAMTNIFTCTTCFAFNFWGLFGNWKDDALVFWGLKYMHWSFLLVAIFYALILLIKPLKKRYTEPYIYFTIALSTLSFFLFSTRMHERYNFPFFGFFLIAVMQLKSKILLALYGLATMLYFINMYVPYIYYNDNMQTSNAFVLHGQKYFQYYSGAFVILFFILIVCYFRALYAKPDTNHR